MAEGQDDKANQGSPTQIATIDLGDKTRHMSLSVSPAELPWDAAIRRAKDVILFLAALVVLGFFLWFSWEILHNPEASADDKKWASSFIAATLSALTGYLLGKKS